MKQEITCIDMGVTHDEEVCFNCVFIHRGTGETETAKPYYHTSASSMDRVFNAQKYLLKSGQKDNHVAL